MPNGKTEHDWVAFHCPACRSQLKVRAAYAHQRGRCPECGFRINAPRPQSAAVRPPVADGEIGLEPIDEDWPEPARVETTDEVGTYTMEPALPRPSSVSPVAGFGPSALDAIPSAADPHDQVDNPYGVMAPAGEQLPSEAPATEHLSKAELNPLRAPPPPPFPLIQGIYTFPWRPANLVTLVVLSAEFAILTLLGCGLVGCWEMLQAQSFTGAFIVPLIAVTCVAALWIGAYAVVQFFVAIEETAAGNDTYPRPDWSMWEGITRLCYLAVMVGLSALPGASLGVLAAAVFPVPAYAWLVPPAVGSLFFPIFLFSTLATNTYWKVFDRTIILPLLAKPQALLALYLPSWVMLSICLLLGFEVLGRFRMGLLPVAGGAFAACLLIYGRLLGRIGWYITLRKVKKPRKKKREPEKEMSEAE